MGASAPTEPPNPIVNDEVSTEDQVLWGLILDSLRDTARSTLVTPCPILSRTTYLTSSRDISIPTPGSIRKRHPSPSPARFPPIRKWLIFSIAPSRTTAAHPESTPIIKLSSRSLLCSDNFPNGLFSCILRFVVSSVL